MQTEFDFYNTIHESGETLESSKGHAKNQQQLIIEFFQKNPSRAFTPFDVANAFGNVWPVTSVRRAMTNLTKENKLMMLPDMVPGPYGKNNHLWKIFQSI